MKKIALITGATSGIGRATALLLAQHGYNLIITGRRETLLHEFATELQTKTQIQVLPLCFDVREQAQVEKYLLSLPEDWKNIDVLINNAGLAVGMDAFHQGVTDDWERMIDTNVKGLLYVSRVITPGMAERKRGHIVNVSSIAGHEVYAKGHVYCASKHAVDAITKGMRIDLLPFGVKVSSVSPGMVETEFSLVRFKGDENKAQAVYQNVDPLTAQDIADTIWYIVSRPAHVNINDVIITPTAQANTSHLIRKA